MFPGFNMMPSLASLYQLPYFGMPQSNSFLQMQDQQQMMNMVHGQPIYPSQLHWNEDPRSVPTALSGREFKERGEDFMAVTPVGPNQTLKGEPNKMEEKEPKDTQFVKVPMPMGL